MTFHEGNHLPPLLIDYAWWVDYILSIYRSRVRHTYGTPNSQPGPMGGRMPLLFHMEKSWVDNACPDSE
jgi:hypothetical protein